jgi:hypothetical protein
MGIDYLLVIFIIACLGVLGQSLNSFNESCPQSLSIYQSNLVKTSFNPLKLEGFWYELAYHDVAQVKETCQYVTRSCDSLGMDEVFGFQYPQRAGQLNLRYDNGAGPGLFTRYIDSPLVRNFKFPSAVVDFTQAKNGDYNTISEYLCYSLNGLVYQEIRILSKSPTISQVELLALEANLKSLGLSFKTLRVADQTNCTY